MLVARRFLRTEPISLLDFAMDKLSRVSQNENPQDHQFVPPEACAGPCEPSRRFVAWGPPRPGVTGLTARTPASLKGNLTRRIFAYLVSSWLTNAIDRI